MKNIISNNFLTKLVVLYHHWSSFIWHEEEGFPSNVGLFKSKMTTSATLSLDKNCPYSFLVFMGKRKKKKNFFFLFLKMKNTFG